MANKQQLPQQPEGPTLGSRLREAREALSLAEEDIADYLRLDKNIVSKIENDQLKPEELTVFVRGYIRAYAKHVNFPVDEVDQYFVAQGLLQPALNLSPAKFELNRNLQRKKVHWVTFVVIAILVISVLSWVFLQRPDKVLMNMVTPAANEAQTTAPASITVQPAVSAPTATVPTAGTASANTATTPITETGNATQSNQVVTSTSVSGDAANSAQVSAHPDSSEQSNIVTHDAATTDVNSEMSQSHADPSIENTTSGTATANQATVNQDDSKSTSGSSSGDSAALDD